MSGLISAMLGGIEATEATSTEPAIDAVPPNQILAGMLILNNTVPTHIIGSDFAILDFAKSSSSATTSARSLSTPCAST